MSFEHRFFSQLKKSVTGKFQDPVSESPRTSVPIAHGGLPLVDSEVRQSSTSPVDTLLSCFTWTIVCVLVSLIHAQV